MHPRLGATCVKLKIFVMFGAKLTAFAICKSCPPVQSAPDSGRIRGRIKAMLFFYLLAWKEQAALFTSVYGRDGVGDRLTVPSSPRNGESEFQSAVLCRKGRHGRLISHAMQLLAENVHVSCILGLTDSGCVKYEK